MKLSLVAVFGLALAPAVWAPVAHAQVDCSEIRRVMVEAETDFSRIKGNKLDDGVFESHYEIGGSHDCTIDLSLAPSYSCDFQFERPDWAYTPYNLRLGEVRRCLSSWKQADIKGEPYRDEGYRMLEGVRFEGSGEYDGKEWAVTIQQHMQSGQAHYHVSVEFTSYN
ncbi:MAG TPA: hypothetical protein VG942_17745 [Hyphomonadaceae bacterium]|nr:hypothetical protein [Hyphomonadaceae bacterium]